MAVEVKYVVIREGEEKMSFTSKKEADAYDKMLDTATSCRSKESAYVDTPTDRRRPALTTKLATAYKQFS